MFENPRRGRQARNFTTNVPKILDRKSSSEQIFSGNCRWVPLKYISQPLNVLILAHFVPFHRAFFATAPWKRLTNEMALEITSLGDE